MTEHFPPEEVEEILSGGLAKERCRAVVAHLLRGCEICRSELARMRRNAVPGPELTPEQSSAYDGVLERAVDFASRLSTLPLSEHHRFQRALSLLSSGRGVVALIDADLALAGLGVCEALLARSWAVRHDNPEEMWHLANVAVHLTMQMSPGE